MNLRKRQIRAARKAKAKGRERLIWDSARDGTYVRAKHGPIGQERIRGR
jgi:hypothetical protein